MLGNWTKGMMPARLFSRMKRNRETRSGRKGRRRASPMKSTPIWLRAML